MEPFNGKFALIDPREIVIDSSYQRPERPALIGDIATDFTWSAFGAISVYRRNGVLYAGDGQQRLKAAMLQDPIPKAVPCIIFPQETIEKEAKSFLTINVNRKAVSPLEKHRAQLVAKDPSALAIERALETVGYSIGMDAENPRSIAAIRALQAIYANLGEEGLVQVLTQARDSWPDDTKGVSVHMLLLINDIITEQRDAGKYNRAKLTNALKSTTPVDLMRKARALAIDAGGGVRQNVRRAAKALIKV